MNLKLLRLEKYFLPYTYTLCTQTYNIVGLALFFVQIVLYCYYIQVQYVVAIVVQWITRKKHYLLMCLAIVMAWITYVVWAKICSLTASNMSLRSENDFLRSEIQALNDSFTYEIHVIKDQNQKLMEQNQTLMKENHKLIDQIQKLTNQYQMLVDQNQTLTMQNHELKDQVQKLTNQYQMLVDQNQTLTVQNHKLIDKVQKLEDQHQLSVNQNEKLTKDNQQLMKHIDQYEANHDMIVMQVFYIKKWMDPISKLEEHIKHVIRYCKLMKKFYAGSDEMDRLRQLIKYDVDEGDDEIIVPKAIELIMKFKKECDKLMNALLSMDFEEMKDLQDGTTTDKIEVMMDNLLVEVTYLQSQKRANEQQRANEQRRANAQRNAVPRNTGSSNTGLQSNSLVGIVIDVGYRFIKWVGGWLFS